MSHLASHAHSDFGHRKFIILLLALPLMILLLQFTRVGTAYADQPDISVDIIPSAVDIPPNPQNGQRGQTGSQVHVEVEITNLSTNTLQALQLCWFTNGAVTVTNSLPKMQCFPPSNTLAPGAQYTWDVELAQTKDRLVPGTVQFRINYKRPANGQPGGLVDRTSFASLAVESLKPQAAQQVASVQVATSLTTLNEQQPGQVYLLVTNTSDFQLQINSLVLKGPDFITLNAHGFKESSNSQQASNSQQQSNKCNNIGNESTNETPSPAGSQSIPPRQTTTIAIDVSTSCPVQPGNQLLVFEIGLQWEDGGQLQTGNLVANQTIQAGVLGSSEILTLLGIPSFLFLPGFLALITVQLLWQLNTRRPASDYPLPLVSPQSGLIAVTLSGIAAFVYPVVTQWLTGVSRNYLVRYDLSDIVNIWLASVGLAIVGFFLVGAGINWWRRYQKWQVQQRTPSANDLPIPILYKLDRQGLGIQRNYLNLAIQGESPHAFLIQRDDGQEKLWVSPTIVVHFGGGTTDALRNEVTSLINAGNARRLADLLSKENHSAWEVSWRPLVIHNTPFQVGRDQFNGPSNPQPIVETEI